MNSSSSTIIEQLEDERSLTYSLINELLLLRQKVNITTYTDESIDSDRIHEVNKRLDALEMRILRIEKKVNSPGLELIQSHLETRSVYRYSKKCGKIRKEFVSCKSTLL